jgi:uncharacterized repeat protein (TIGR03803 family)
LDAAGNLYGTAASGGSFSNGVVYKIDAKGTETVLHSFTEGDGALPRSTLIQDEAGNLYGTTQRGGHGGGTGGVVFELSPQSGGRWEETTLYKFCAQRHCPDGNMPTGKLVRDSAGNLYGTTLLGGAGFGVVFELAPNGKETLLYSFAGLSDGGEPLSLIQDNVGNLYGTAVEGGDLSCAEGGCGVIFELTPQ